METYRHRMFKGVLKSLVVHNKEIFVEAIIAYAKDLEANGLVPTRENTYLVNIHTLLDFRDEFLARVDIPSRMDLVEALFTIGISEYAHDTVYQFFIDWLVYMFKKTDWTIPNRWENPYWNEYLGARKRK